MSPDNFTQDHYLKTEWLFADVTVVGCRDRGGHAILGMILSVLWPIQATFGVGEPFCDIEIPTSALIGLLRVA